jgi:hypothetical protein
MGALEAGLLDIWIAVCEGEVGELQSSTAAAAAAAAESSDLQKKRTSEW